MSAWSRGVEELEEANEEGLMEGELAQLQLRYRVMQNSFAAYKQETRRKITRQKQLVQQLEDDNTVLDNDLSKLENAQNKAIDDKNIRTLKELSKREKEYYELIEAEKEHIKTLDKEIAEGNAKITEQRKHMETANSAAAAAHSSKKNISVWENKLNKVVVLFNKQLSTNNKLRHEIDHLRHERSVFDTLYKKLTFEMDKSKREMAEVIRESTEAFEQRNDVRNKIMAVIERSENDKEQHEDELRNHQRMIHHNNRIREFIGIKASDRLELKAEEAAKKQKMDADKMANATQVTINQYEVALNKLRATTAESDINAIVEAFEKNEDENFALFNYVNELNNEMESLTDRVTAVNRDIAQFQTEDQKLDEIHANMVRQLETQIDTVQTDTEHAEKNLRRVTKLLEELFTSIADLFTRIGCDSSPIQQMLDCDSSIRSKNVMIYMGQIEQRTSELLSAQAFKNKRFSVLQGDVPSKPADLTTAPIPSGITEFSIPAPSVASVDTIGTGDKSEDQLEDGMAPFSQEELRKQVAKYIQSRTVPATEQCSLMSTTRDKKKKQK